MVMKVPVIAIMGNTGKTTTKEMLASILKTKWKLFENTDDQNFALFTKKKLNALKRKNDAILLELRNVGAARRSERYFRPDIVVFTKIDLAQQSIWLQNHNKNKILILNQDDMKDDSYYTDAHDGKIITVGIKHDADYRASNIKLRQDRVEFDMHVNRMVYPVVIPTIGKHNVYNALLAIAVAHRCGFSLEQIQEGLSAFQATNKSLKTYPLMEGALLIDDTVHANVESVKAAVHVMNEIGTYKRKILILGSMPGLGTLNEQAHMEIGRYIARHRIDVVYTYGEEAESVGKRAIEAGMKPDQIHHFTDRERLHQRLKSEAMNKSVILVKGPASMEMGLTVEWLRSYRYGYVFINNGQRSDEIHVHPETLHRLQLKDKKLKLRFGNYFKTLQIKPDINTPRDCLSIPRKLSDCMHIPHVKYESRFVQNELHIGPVIAFLVMPKHIDALEKQLLDCNLHRTGLIYMFCPHPTHRHKETIEGLYYDPVKRTFLPGSLPFPSVIFNRANIDSFMHMIYEERIGNKIFNYPNASMDKWRIWNLAVSDPLLKRYFPTTVRYTGIAPINHMVKKFGSIYIKPRTGTSGKGIVAIRKIKNKTVFIRDNGQRWQVRSRKQLRALLKKYLLKKKGYIIQRAFANHFNIGKVAFRSYIQKGKDGLWEQTGMEVKIESSGSITSNSNSRMKIMPGIEGLKQIYGLDEAQAMSKMDEVRMVGIRILKLLEKNSSLLGEAAIDFVIDHQQNICISDVHLDHAEMIRQYHFPDQHEIFSYILAKPFEYARYLAGFEP